jgi:hypothetical protein
VIEPTPTSEERIGPTPNGGVRSVAYFRDRKGNLCPKAEAAAMEVVEFDASGRAVFRTYMQIGNDPVPI